VKYARREHTHRNMATNADSLVVLLEQCKWQQINRDEQPIISRPFAVTSKSA
jgi:hypothetical protein